jgi:hypothetical protein
MQKKKKGLEIAIREIGFGSPENDSVNILFIVSEPDAAAAYVLANTTAFLVRREPSPLTSFNNIDFCSLRRYLYLLMLVGVLLTL